VEMGTTIQLLNLSKNPSADWDQEGVDLPLTGRDVNDRRAAVYLTHEQMEAMDLEPGDMIQVRAKDESGNVSGAVTVELQGNEWAGNLIQEKGDNNAAVFSRGAQISVLDGEAVRKTMIAKAVNDKRPPLVDESKVSFGFSSRSLKDVVVAFDQLNSLKPEQQAAYKAAIGGNWGANVDGRWFLSTANLDALAKLDVLPEAMRAAARKLADDPALLQRVSLAGKNLQGGAGMVAWEDIHAVATNNNVNLVVDRAMEPQANVSVQNQRTGQVFNGRVGDDGKLTMSLGDAVRDGDPMIMSVSDNNGIAGKPVELVFSSKFDNGKAPKLAGGLSIRLPGVI